MAENIRFSLGNLLAVSFIAVLAVGATVWLTRWFAAQSIPGISHLAVGGQAFLGA